MGCGGSKEEVATANITVTKRSLFRRKSSISIGKSSETASAETQKNTKTEDPAKTKETIQERTEVPQNSADKTEIPVILSEEKTETKTVDPKAEEKTEDKEKPESELVAKPKSDEEEAVARTDGEVLPVSTNIDSSKEETENKMIKPNEEASVIDTSRNQDVVAQEQQIDNNDAKEETKDSTMITEAAREESKDSTMITEAAREESKDSTMIAEAAKEETKNSSMIAEASEKNEEIVLSKDANVVVESNDEILSSELKETTSTVEAIVESKGTASTEEANAESQGTTSSEETKIEMQEATSTEQPNNDVKDTTPPQESNTQVAISEEKTLEENPATKESDD